MTSEPSAEPTATTTETTPPVAAPPSGAVVVPAASPPAADWREILKSVPLEDLRKHERVAGIAGELAERRTAAERQRWQQEQAEKAARDAEARLRQLAQDNPTAFAEEYLSEAEKKRLASELEAVRGKTREEFAQHLGRGYHQVPEWSSLTTEDFERLASAVAGKADDDVLGAYNAAALDLIARKRAERLFSERWEREIAKEREAMEKSVAAKLLQTDPGPGLVKPTRSAPDSEVNRLLDLNDKDFNQEYEKRILRRR